MVNNRPIESRRANFGERCLDNVGLQCFPGRLFNHAVTAGDLRYHFRDEANAVHILEVTPNDWTKPKRRLIIFATPNGNTAEQSYGAIAKSGRDWHFDIQHIGAQFRYVQSHSEDADLVLVILQPGQLSWPAFRQSVDGADQQIRRLIESLQSKFKADETYLTCHSGGGSLLWGWINAHDELPASVSRLVWLDANYSYSDQLEHGDKLLRWLTSHDSARLCVLAYDDREVENQGKKVVSADGGTYRATDRMISRFEQNENATRSQMADFQATAFLDEKLASENGKATANGKHTPTSRTWPMPAIGVDTRITCIPLPYEKLATGKR